MNNLCIDMGYNSLFKYGEQLCGDHIEVVQNDGDLTVMVLADGLGSGVKANILATLTAKIISTMMAQSMSIEECTRTVASTLPVCGERQLAYSTFTIIIIRDNINVEIIQYDNPHVIMLRDGKNYKYPMTKISIDNKTIYQSKFMLKENDTFVSMSDGVTHAGPEKQLNYSWDRDNIIDFLQIMYELDFTAKTLTTILLDECNKLYCGKPSDDTTVSTIRLRKRKPVNLLIGPPALSTDVSRMMSLFFSKEGKHIVCGGTTSQLAAEFLGKSIKSNTTYIDPEIPPTSTIDGVDLVTEGVITISRVLFYAKNYLEDNSKYTEWGYKKDGASIIARILFEEATDINFFVGKAVNPAHQNPELPINFTIKMHLIEELSQKLEKMGKKIKISYF